MSRTIGLGFCLLAKERLAASPPWLHCDLLTLWVDIAAGPMFVDPQGFSKKPIVQLNVVEEFGILLSLSDSYVCVHDLTTYREHARMEKTRGQYTVTPLPLLSPSVSLERRRRPPSLPLSRQLAGSSSLTDWPDFVLDVHCRACRGDVLRRGCPGPGGFAG